MYAPATDDEITGLVHYLDQQLTAIRAAAVGLTDEQARQRPCRSALSIGGLITHVTYGMEGATERLTGGAVRGEIDQEGYAAYMGSFAVADDVPVADALAEFDRIRPAYLAAVAATDPDAPTTEPPSPWFGIHDARPANGRYYLVHQIEEMARHAGHADILREELDGTAVPQIVLSQEGAPANDYFQPYVAADGTLV